MHAALCYLKEQRAEDLLVMLHLHPGSDITGEKGSMVLLAPTVRQRAGGSR